MGFDEVSADGSENSSDSEESSLPSFRGTPREVPQRWRRSRRVLGAALFLWFVLLFLGGFLAPLLWLALMFLGRYVTATVFLAAATTPYFFPVRPLAWCKSLLRHSRDYFDHCTVSYAAPFFEELQQAQDPDAVSDSPASPGNLKPFLMCVAPHGVFCIGFVQLAMEESLAGVRFLMAKALYQAPFFNLFILRMVGSFGSVSAKDMSERMRTGENLAIIPGGFHEATLHSHAVDRVFIKNRKGFVKYALRFGYDIVPVWVAGESQTYVNVWQSNWDLRLAMANWCIPGVVPFGAWFCPLLPSPNCNIDVAVGERIRLPKILAPTEQDVNTWHQVYSDAMLALQRRTNTKALEIW